MIEDHPSELINIVILLYEKWVKVRAGNKIKVPAALRS